MEKIFERLKDMSNHHVRLEKGSIKKDKFWIPKYTADAYDGKHLWLLINEEEVHSKHVIEMNHLNEGI